MKRIFLIVDRIAMKWIVIIGFLWLGFAIFNKPLAMLDIEPKTIKAAKKALDMLRGTFVNSPSGEISVRRKIIIDGVEWDDRIKVLKIKQGATITVEEAK